MILYHGTCSTLRDQIAANGLLPRRSTGNNRWTHTAESIDDRVYLTNTYAPYFAFATTQEGGLPMVVEVDVPAEHEALLTADEDFYTYQNHAQGMNNTVAQLEARATSLMSIGQWRESLATTGTCAYVGNIPAEWITRMVTLDFSTNHTMAVACVDISVTPIGHAIHHAEMQARQRWCLGESVAAKCLGFNAQLMLGGKLAHAKFAKVFANRVHKEVYRRSTAK